MSKSKKTKVESGKAICGHPLAYPVGTPDRDGSQVWCCPDPPSGCSQVIGKKPVGWKPEGKK
jgi:hypothetical protein